MGVFDFLSKQFVDVIDWTEAPGDLALRYPMQDREIQNGGQLTVRDNQLALFYNEGRVADAFEPGLHTLETANLPVLTSIMNWDKGFRSPFKADIYFFSMKEHAGLKWGTQQPITVRDKEFGPIRVRAFGSYSFRIADVAKFASTLMGTLEHVAVADVESQLRGAIATAIASALGKGDVAFLDIAGDQQAMSERLKAAVEPAFAAWGLAVASFFVESVSLPEDVQAHLDKGSAMRVIGNLDQYARFQAADAIGTAAGNDSGMAGLGVGAAAGAAIGQAMQAGFAQPGPTPPAASAASEPDPYEQIEKLHRLVTAGAISQAEFDAKKVELLARIR